MLEKLRDRAEDQRGYTHVALIGAVLITAIVAVAIAVPTLAIRSAFAPDASAKAMAREAAATAELIAGNHSGSYSRVGLLRLRKDDPNLRIHSTSGGSWLSEASSSADSYSVTVTAPASGETFTITRSPNHSLVRTCTADGRSGSCVRGAW